MEFPEMEAHIAKLDEHLYRERGIHITTLRHPRGFEWLMLDAPLQRWCFRSFRSSSILCRGQHQQEAR
mgnify:CR=1 FL=1